MWLLSSVLFVVFSGSIPVHAAAQEPQDKIEEPTSQEFFSGTVSEVPEGRVVVVRTLQGRSPESRTFLINADTKIEGRLRPKVRVTVGYKATDDGEVAIRIIVRSQTNSKK